VSEVLSTDKWMKEANIYPGPRKKTSSQREKVNPKSQGPSSNSQATTTSLSRKENLRKRFLSFRGDGKLPQIF
jgi:hypothetical protein